MTIPKLYVSYDTSKYINKSWQRNRKVYKTVENFNSPFLIINRT
jgi:hypothetical protein